MATAVLSTASPREQHVAVDRRTLFAGVIVLGLVNGLAQPVWHGIVQNGAWSALATTFDVSAIVWLAALALPALALRMPAGAPGRDDRVVAGVAAALAIVPFAPASWLALTGVALHLMRDAATRRTAVVLLATVNATFWGRLLLQSSGTILLDIDAALVALLTGQPHVGNVVQTVGDGGALWIAPYCSSLTNVSLAMLFSVLAVNWYGLAWRREHALRCLAAVVAMVAINDARIAVMVLRPDLYFIVHGTPGALVANIASMIAIAVIVLPGIDRARRARD